MRKIVLESLVEYPGQQVEAAATASAKQLVAVASGEGVLTSIWHTYGIIEQYMPAVAPGRRLLTYSAGKCRSCSSAFLPLSSTYGLVGSVRLR
jgi:hypothetical protein